MPIYISRSSVPSAHTTGRLKDNGVQIAALSSAPGRARSSSKTRSNTPATALSEGAWGEWACPIPMTETSALRTSRRL